MAYGSNETITLNLDDDFTSDFERSEVGTVLRNTPMITAVLHMDLTVAYANDLFLDFVGASSRQAVRGQHIGDLCGCIYSEGTGTCGASKDCPRCGLRLTMEEAAATATADGQALLIRRTGGSIQPQSLNASAYRISMNGEAYVVFHLVLTGDRVMREALERLFLHDALNSISGIQGLATTLKAGSSNGQEKMLDVIESYAKALAEEIKFYRCLRDAEGGVLDVDSGPVYTDHLMEQVASLNTHLADSRGKFVAFDLETCGLKLYSDVRLLKRVLGNLVKNAIEATPDKGFVLFKCEGGENSVTFSVYNDGFIPESLRPGLFRGGISSKGAGRGMGLYGVKLLTEQFLGGAVSFSSSEQAGTWFHVCFPVGSA